MTQSKISKMVAHETKHFYKETTASALLSCTLHNYKTTEYCFIADFNIQHSYVFSLHSTFFFRHRYMVTLVYGDFNETFSAFDYWSMTDHQNHISFFFTLVLIRDFKMNSGRPADASVPNLRRILSEYCTERPKEPFHFYYSIKRCHFYSSISSWNKNKNILFFLKRTVRTQRFDYIVIVIVRLSK
jgi:hypothetical protein